MLEDEMIKSGLKVEQNIVKNYEDLLPNELIKVWERFGFGYLLDGYLKIINPDEYQQLLIETYFRGNESIPIMVSAFGDIITLEESQYIGIVKYKDGDFTIMARSFTRFMQNVSNKYFIDKYFQIPRYIEARNRFGNLKEDECFGYVPLLGLGGSENVDNLTKVKIREHIELIAQMVGRIGM